jgi:hypothetical protein
MVNRLVERETELQRGRRLEASYISWNNSLTVDPAATVAVCVDAAVDEVPALQVKSEDLTSVIGELSEQGLRLPEVTSKESLTYSCCSDGRTGKEW